MVVQSCWILRTQFLLLTYYYGTFVARFSHCNITPPFPGFHAVLFRSKSVSTVHTEKMSPISWGENIYINYLESVCWGGVSLVSHFKIYSIIYVNTDTWVFSLYCSYNTWLVFLFRCSNCSTLAIGSAFSWLLHPFDLPPPFCFLSTSLL